MIVNIDNSLPEVDIELVSNTNMTTGATNNSHISKDHVVVIKATLSDHSLLDNSTVSSSTNYSSGVVLEYVNGGKQEFYARINGTVLEEKQIVSKFQNFGTLCEGLSLALTGGYNL